MGYCKKVTVAILCSIFLLASFCCAGKDVTPKKAKEAEAYYLRAISYMQKDKPQEALLNLQEAVKLNPSDPRFFDAMGLVYFSTETFDKAEESYREAIKVDPKYTDAHHNLGVLYNHLGRYDEAISEFELVLQDELYRNRANTLNALGWAYHKKADYKNAEDAFKKTIKHDRLYLIAYDNLGKVYIDSKRYDEAVAILEQVLKLESNYPEARLDLGIAYLKLGKTDEAKTEFERAIALDPQGPIGKEAKKYLELLK